MRAVKNSEKVTKEINQRQKKRAQNIKLVFISLILCLICFVALIIMERNIIKREETDNIVVATTHISEGTKVTKENINSLFEIQERNVSQLPDDYVISIAELEESFISRDYKPNEVITYDYIKDEASMIEHIKHPIEISLSINSLSNAVGGILRPGDRVNLYNTYSTSSYSGKGKVTSTPIMLNAYITKALTSSGAEISTEDKETTATMINIIIEAESEAAFNEAIYNGTLRLSKILYDVDEKPSTSVISEDTDNKKEDSNKDTKEESNKDTKEESNDAVKDTNITDNNTDTKTENNTENENNTTKIDTTVDEKEDTEPEIQTMP